MTDKTQLKPVSEMLKERENEPTAEVETPICDNCFYAASVTDPFGKPVPICSAPSWLALLCDSCDTPIVQKKAVPNEPPECLKIAVDYWTMYFL